MRYFATEEDVMGALNECKTALKDEVEHLHLMAPRGDFTLWAAQIRERLESILSMTLEDHFGNKSTREEFV